ncbi:HTH domain-containing protein [Rhodonellum sp.]|uniref:HTH domain-containing protein n=1 Tax=Rhodonellum sp. TaxID=2231180 RepID=UPI0027169843|nr:HTH domain-containing protein [Rhodonellum sp.]MDO9554554.1 HTH domain-containing protein [Rhodonellum sp.]
MKNDFTNFLRFVKIVDLLNEPSSVHKISNEMGVDNRSVYRYLVELKQQGFKIERDGYKYKIIEASQDFKNAINNLNGKLKTL